MLRRLDRAFVVLVAAVCASTALGFAQRHAAAAAPRPVPAVAAPFTFVAYGDTRSFPDTHRGIVAEIMKQHPALVVQTGDCVLVGGDRSLWTEFDNVIAPIRAAHIPYYVARGNHDLGPYVQNELKDPTLPGGTKFNYAVEKNRNLFVALDSFQSFEPQSSQYRWLEKQLQYGKAHDINTFVFFHESPFSVGPHGPNPQAQEYLHPLFVKYHPRAVFCGHDHLYYRTTRDGVTYLVTGGGGAELYTPTHKSLAIQGDVIVKEHHIIRLDVVGARVTGTVLTAEDKVIDRFTL